MVVNRYLLGVDLAKSLDYTAFAIIHQVWDPGIMDFVYHLVGLDRIQGVEYPAIVDIIVATMERLGKERGVSDGPHLCLDASGLGAPIRDYLKQYRIFCGGKHGRQIFPVGFVGGESYRYNVDTGNYNISKTLVISNFLSLMQHHRFDYAPDLQALPLLEEEIANFQYHLTASGHVGMDAAAGKHDDLITAISIPLIIGEHEYNHGPKSTWPSAPNVAM